MPGYSRYATMMPTRTKIRFFWASVIGLNVTYQFAIFLADNVVKQRTAKNLSDLREKVGDRLPPEVEDQLLAGKTAMDALGKHAMVATPAPGEVTDAFMYELDDLRLSALRK